MDIIAAHDRPARRAPARWFTGQVWQQPIVAAPAPARLQALLVTFLPGARTNWHTHPLGQTLFVTAGTAIVATRTGAPRLLGAGDAAVFAPGEEHWHGAAPASPMAHVAMQEAEDGRAADWLEAVAEDDYAAAAAALGLPQAPPSVD